MASNEHTSVWMYDPSFALAVIGAVAYGIVFFAITYMTLIKYRAWYFSVIVVGAAIEVVAYIARVYSVRNRSEIVSLTYPQAWLYFKMLTRNPGAICHDAYYDGPCARFHRRCQLHAH